MNILKEKQNKMAAGFPQNDSDVKKKYTLIINILCQLQGTVYFNNRKWLWLTSTLLIKTVC